MLVAIFINILLTFLDNGWERYKWGDSNFSQSLYGVFPGLLGQCILATYPRRTDHVTRDSLVVRNNEATEWKPLTAYANSEK